jgi:hypothetical protein
MRNTAIEEILNYWNALRRERAAPLRSEFDPAALRHFLPHLFILAAQPSGRLTFALAGTRVCELFDRELRGSDYLSIWGREGTDSNPFEIAESVRLYERPVLIDVSISPNGQLYPYDLLLMPLRSSETGGSDRILGALVPRAASLPPIQLPIARLTLESWSPLDAGRVRPRRPVEEETGSVTFIRRLIGGGWFVQAGH